MKLSKSEMLMIAEMRGIKVSKKIKMDDLIRVLSQEDKILHKKSPFKSIIENIKEKLQTLGSKVPKSESDLIKRGLYEVEKMKNLSESDIKNVSEKLNKFEDDLLKKNRYNNHDVNYKGIKDIRHLFDEGEDYYYYYYYEPKLINTPFKNNYFHYESGSNKKNVITR